MTLLFSIGSVAVYRDDNVISWTGPLAIDDDGDPDAEAPAGIAHHDALANAGHPGNWWGIATDTGKPDGTPIVQGPGDPMPGAYVSETALADPTKKAGDPARYVDAQTVPYISLPPEMFHAGVCKGDVCLVSYGANQCAAIVGDVGPRGKLGEGSPALARPLAINDDPRRGGAAGGVAFRVFVGSKAVPAWPRTVGDIEQQVATLSANV